MRVLIISANWGKGGPGGVASELYNVIKTEGHECRFAYARESIPSEINSYRFGNMMDVYIHVLSARLFDNAGFMSSRATDKLIEEIRRYKPDIISIHNFLGYTINVEKLFRYIKGSKIITFLTLHDCWTITGHCITGLCDNWKRECGNCPRKQDFPKSILFDNSRKNLKRKKEIFSDIDNLYLITPSVWLSKLIKETYLKKYDVTVIHNGIDLMVFKPTSSRFREKYNLVGKTILLAVAGIWSKTKGAEYIYKLTELLDSSFAFVLIGYNNDNELKNNKKIIHIERTENRCELAQWYSTADIFVNPTMGDNFPTVNLEALACGTPVVTFNTGGSGESVGECGMVVPQGNIDALANSLKCCKEKIISAEMCIAQAQNFDKTICYRKYIKLFEQSCI